jgi:hypothetical protein
MNYAEKMEMESRILGNVARWMERRGKVLTDRRQSNAFCGIRVLEVLWRGITFVIFEVDGMTCRIERAAKKEG